MRLDWFKFAVVKYFLFLFLLMAGCQSNTSTPETGENNRPGNYKPNWTVDCDNIPVAPKDSSLIDKSLAEIDSMIFAAIMPKVKKVFAPYSDHWPPAYDTVAALTAASFELAKHPPPHIHKAVGLEIQSFNTQEWDAQQWLNYFSRDSGGVWCRNHTHFLSRLLERYYPTGEMNIGIDSGGVHVLNVVKIDGMFFPVDGTYGNLYVWATADKPLQPISVRDIIAETKKGNEESFLAMSINTEHDFLAKYLATNPCYCFTDAVNGKLDAAYSQQVRQSWNHNAPFLCEGLNMTDNFLKWSRKNLNILAERYGDRHGIQNANDLKKLPLYANQIHASPKNSKHFRTLKAQMDSVFKAVEWHGN